MYPHGGAALTPSLSRPRVMPIPVALPVALHVNSSRKVHRSADGIINIMQEILFYAEGGVKSLAGKQLKEVHAPPVEHRGRFSAETSARVFVGERLIRMHIQTSIRPNNSDSLEIDEVFHFAENADAPVFPIAFEATLQQKKGSAAAEFDLSSPIVATLKQRIVKTEGEKYKVVQAIELRANEADGPPTQELVRKSTISTPTNEGGVAKFHERIFAGVDCVRVDRDINFVCDRPVLALSERREYMPEYPAAAPRRRSSSVAPATPRVSLTPSAPRSRSHSRSRADTDNCPTACEDLPTATSPYSLFDDNPFNEASSCGSTRTARGATPNALSPSFSSDRNSRSKRKKWTVNSVVAKAGASTPEHERTMRSLSTARNLSISPALDRSVGKQPASRGRSSNGETMAIQPVVIQPAPELGPHGECTLGMEVQQAAVPVDSLIRTCYDGSPCRSSSDCSTAGEIRTPYSTNNNACESLPFSPAHTMPVTNESSSRASTPMRTARNQSPICQPHQREEPASALLNMRRAMF
ncbi:hypothetical protein PFISCL1PPCAC_25374, partial [Pristionchus fissidentatus]